MSFNKTDILQKTSQGLDVFKHYIKGEWKVGKPFLNPLYNDTKPSCYIFKDIKQNVYKIKDFGDSTFHGDCFFFVGKLFNKDSRQKDDFFEILKIINQDLQLFLELNWKNGIPIPQKSKTTQNNVIIDEVKVDSTHSKVEITKNRGFSNSEIDYWSRYGITLATLNKYNVLSVQMYDATTKDGKSFTLKSCPNEPIFAYVGENHTKLYRPFSKQRFLYGGILPEPYIFGIEQLPSRGDILFITGGEKDVLSLVSKGFNAICFNSETANVPKRIIKKLKYRFQHICILYDCDKTGIESSKKIITYLKEFALKNLTLPLKGTKEEKDISDFFKLGYSRDQLLELFGLLLDEVYEETMSILKSCEIDFDNPPIKPEPMIAINGVTIGSPGNLLCITGSEGSGKSNYLGGIIAGVFHNSSVEIDTFGADIKYNAWHRAVLIFDTEQSEDQLYKNMSFILKRAEIDRPPDWFKVYGLVGMSRKERMQLIFQSIDKFYYDYKGIHLVVIDGIADLLSGVNDEEASVELVDELFRLAGIYKTCIICVLHMSPSGMKLRGHLGSEMQRKAAGILSIEKEENTNISFVKALKVRDGSPMDVPLIQFAWSPEKNRHVYLGVKSKEDTELRRINDLRLLAQELFAKQKTYTYSNLMKAIMELLAIKDRMAKNHIKSMKDFNIIKKSSENNDDYIFENS